MERITMAELRAGGVVHYGDGYRTKRSEHGRPGLRILRVSDVGDGRVQLDGPDFVSVDRRTAIGSKVAEPGDVLLTTKGTVGRVAIMPAAAEPVVYSPQLCYFRVIDHDTLDRRYLSYWFRSASFRSQAIHRANNTDMAPYINLADISSLSIDVPEIGEQRAIAEVLGTLDDKFAANERVVASAANLSRATWQAATDGEHTLALSSMARFINGRAFTKDASGTGRVVIRIAELNSGIGPSTVYNDLDVPDEHLAGPGDLLFAWSGSLTVTRWFREEGIVNQHIFKVIPVGTWSRATVHQTLLKALDEFKSIAADKATTMGHIQRKHLDVQVPTPSSDRFQTVTDQLEDLWDAALAVERESLTLARTRDELLPLLMSGRLRVKDAAQRSDDALRGASSLSPLL